MRPYNAQQWDAPEESEATELLRFAEAEARSAVEDPE